MNRKELNKCIENCCDAIVNNNHYSSADGWLEIVKLIDEYEEVKKCSIPNVLGSFWSDDAITRLKAEYFEKGLKSK